MNTIVLDDPHNIRAAPMHPDPFAYLGRLAVERPLYREDDAGAWVAASARAVLAVLTSDICFTRPVDNPVPEVMRGTPIAEIFARLVRMRNDASHCPLKNSMSAALRSADLSAAADIARVFAATLGAEIEPARDRVRLTQFITTYPAHAIAALVGAPRDRFADVARWIGEYGAATAAAVTGVPAASAEIVNAGAVAARELLTLFAALKAEASSEDSLFGAFIKQADGMDSDSLIANGIGFMAQGFGATSSLMGTTLLALAREDAARMALQDDPRLLPSLMQETLRCDPSTQSTLRFVASDGIVAGQEMRAGDMIIVSFAAANRDPALNADPNRFDIFRADRKYLEFGAGAHACPGDRIATLVAQIGVEYLLAAGVPLKGLPTCVSYRPSAHIRLPAFS